MEVPESGSFPKCSRDSRGKPRASERIHNALGRNSGAQTNIPVRKDRQKNVTSKFEWSKLRDSSLPLSVIQTGIKQDGSPNAPPYDQGSLRWNQDQEEFARRTACKFQKGAREIKGTT